MKDTYSFQHADQYKMLDANTLLRDEDGTEKDVPHFYVNIIDIRLIFAGWKFEWCPVEIAEYKMDNSTNCSKHWMLLVRK